MYVIISTAAPRKWISGIFLRAEDAEAGLLALPCEPSTHHVIESTPSDSFPLFILEDRAGFTFFDEVGMERALQEMPDPAPNAEPIMFAILAEFRPGTPGRDEMGALRHTHLDGDRIAELRHSGLREFAV